jgi:hypothetical protein
MTKFKFKKNKHKLNADYTNAATLGFEKAQMSQIKPEK